MLHYYNFIPHYDAWTFLLQISDPGNLQKYHGVHLFYMLASWDEQSQKQQIITVTTYYTTDF
jgi:hypothetical protein